MKIYPYPSPEADARITETVERGLSFNDTAQAEVAAILAAVRAEKDAAVIRYTNKFDAPGLTAGSLVVSDAEFEAAAQQVDAAFLRALERAASQVESFHRKQLTPSWHDTPRAGVFLGQMVRPVDAAGVYVPGSIGGETPLVSSVLMGAIPAKIAGVPEVVMATPPMADGRVNPYLLVAARHVGIDRVYKMGSAWAIAALTYGTETVKPVNVIVGPGNVYVTLAKQMVAGTVGIDMIAGPSEILVIADSSAEPDHIAADLLSQAEHDTMASAVLVTPDPDLANLVQAAVARQMAELPRKEIAEASIREYGSIFVTETLAEAFEISNQLAPEHLELQIDAPFEWLSMVRNAGAVFMGKYTPESVGDYVAGPNHVLPTAGTAKFASALSVEHFVKKTSLIHYSRQAFLDEADDIVRIAEIEGLAAHANAVKVRR